MDFMVHLILWYHCNFIDSNLNIKQDKYVFQNKNSKIILQYLVTNLCENGLVWGQKLPGGILVKGYSDRFRKIRRKNLCRSIFQ